MAPPDVLPISCENRKNSPRALLTDLNLDKACSASRDEMYLDMQKLDLSK